MFLIPVTVLWAQLLPSNLGDRLLTISWNVAKRATTLTIDIVKMLKLTFIGSFSVLLGYSLKSLKYIFFGI